MKKNRARSIRTHITFRSEDGVEKGMYLLNRELRKYGHDHSSAVRTYLNNHHPGSKLYTIAGVKGFTIEEAEAMDWNTISKWLRQIDQKGYDKLFSTFLNGAIKQEVLMKAMQDLLVTGKATITIEI